MRYCYKHGNDTFVLRHITMIKKLSTAEIEIHTVSGLYKCWYKSIRVRDDHYDELQTLLENL